MSDLDCVNVLVMTVNVYMSRTDIDFEKKGEMLGFALSGGLINTTVDTGGMHFDGWELVFYLFGLFGIIWFPFFVWRVSFFVCRLYH